MYRIIYLKFTKYGEKRWSAFYEKALPATKYWEGKKCFPSAMSIRLLKRKQKTWLYPFDSFQSLLDPVILIPAKIPKSSRGLWVKCHYFPEFWSLEFEIVIKIYQQICAINKLYKVIMNIYLIFKINRGINVKSKKMVYC